MGGESGIFPGKNSALVGNKLPQQIRILEVERIHGEINFGFRPRSADFAQRRAATSAAFTWFFRASFSRHSALFDFAMERVAAESRIIFFELKLFGLELFVARGGVARRRFTLLAGLRTLNGNDFPWHNWLRFLFPLASLRALLLRPQLP